MNSSNFSTLDLVSYQNNSNFTLNDDELGGLAYFNRFISYYLPYVVWCLIEIVLGIGGKFSALTLKMTISVEI